MSYSEAAERYLLSVVRRCIPSQSSSHSLTLDPSASFRDLKTVCVCGLWEEKPCLKELRIYVIPSQMSLRTADGTSGIVSRFHCAVFLDEG